MGRPKNDNNELQSKTPGHMKGILGSFTRMIESSLKLPLNLMKLRLMYPDTGYVNVLRMIIKHGGYMLPGNLAFNALQKRALTRVKLGKYFCIYWNHRKRCILRHMCTLWHGSYVVMRRPVVLNVHTIGTYGKARDYTLEKKKIKERKVLRAVLPNLGVQMVAIGATVCSAFSKYWPFDRLTTSIIATSLLHPLDVMKVRLQLWPEAWGVNLFAQMIRVEGIRAPYTGLTAGILRQTTYTTSKLGTYYCLYEYHKNLYGRVPGLKEKVSMGVCSGLVGALVGCPAEVVLVRMVADGPVDPYRRYRNIAHAFVRICREEGVQTLWRGSLLTMSRSVVISVAQIGTYSQTRDFLKERNNKGFLLHLNTSMISSFVTALATLPIDTFKTRYQVSPKASHGDIYRKYASTCGAMGFWRGFTPYYIRLSIHTLIVFYLLEMMYDLHDKARKKTIL